MTKVTEKTVPLSQISPNSWNPKDGDIARSSRVNKSLSAHGQVEPLLVREIGKDEYELINGYHRLMEMRSLGWDKAVIYNVGKISEDQAKSLALATEDANIPIDRLLASKMVDELLSESQNNLKYLPYSEQEAKAMSSLARFDWHDTVLSEEEAPSNKAKGDKRRMIEIPSSILADWKSALQAFGGSDTEFLIHLLGDYANSEENAKLSSVEAE